MHERLYAPMVPRQTLVRFRRQPPLVRRYLVEAMLSLLLARLALRFVPFRRLKWYFERPPRRPESTYARRAQIWRILVSKNYTPCRDAIDGVERRRLYAGIPWLIGEAASFLPGETTCFARTIAAQAILRRLGIGTTVYYGAKTRTEGGLAAHVWLQDGDSGVIGHETASEYRVLARYPDKKKERKN